MRNRILQTGTGFKLNLLSTVFSLLATTCYTHSMPTESLYHRIHGMLKKYR